MSGGNCHCCRGPHWNGPTRRNMSLIAYGGGNSYKTPKNTGGSRICSCHRKPSNFVDYKINGSYRRGNCC